MTDHWYARRKYVELPVLENTIKVYKPEDVVKVVQFLYKECDVQIQRMAELGKLSRGMVSQVNNGKAIWGIDIRSLYRFKGLIDGYIGRKKDKYNYPKPTEYTLLNPNKIEHLLELYNVRPEDIYTWLTNDIKRETIAASRKRKSWSFRVLLGFSAAFDALTGFISKTPVEEKYEEVLAPNTKRLRDKNEYIEWYFSRNLPSVQPKIRKTS